MTPINPFTERGRITDPARFAGRWSELSLLFERLEAGRAVLLAGTAGVGKSSLLTHVIQSAAVNLELPELRAYYLDLAPATGAADVYRIVGEALGQRGDTLATLELALVATAEPVLLCLDNAQGPLATGWGAGMLEALARVARGGNLMLVVAMEGAPPALSERFAMLRLGALAQTEVRLLADAYLEGTGVSFTPAELRDVTDLSAAHPAYVQRAAFHLFQSKVEPNGDWRAAYRAEVRARPIPGAPLPPSVFEGTRSERMGQSSYSDGEVIAPGQQAPGQLPVPEVPRALLFAIPLLLAALLLLITSSVPLALIAAVAGVAGVARWSRRNQR
jgi:hypothetical protein